MKKKLLLLITIATTYAVAAQVPSYITPSSFNEDELITITLDENDFNPVTEWGVSEIYLWAWHFDSNGTQINNPTATGTDFGNSPASARFNYDAGTGLYTYQLTPNSFFNDTNISEIGYLIKNQDGTEQGQDNIVPVGRVRVEITNPTGEFILVNSGGTVSVDAVVISGGSATVNGNFEAFYTPNGGTETLVDSGSCGFPNCAIQFSGVTESGELRIVGTPPGGGTETGEATISVQIIPTVVQEALPANMEDGINYNSNDTEATLVLYAPGKDFVQVAASWNNYQPSTADVMKQDPTTGKFWLEITGLTPGQVETYQYWVYDATPATDSPVLVKTADPYSTLVLSPFDDPFIPDASFPGLGPGGAYEYPAGQEFEVSVLETGQTPYNWQVTNFVKPKIEDLIVYEVLVRDFDADRNFQDLIDRIDYFKNLNINAIHLMPIQEFEGNESWGYNPSYHMALDKFYGTPDKFKEFVDLCHQNGIAVILDQVLNHAFGRSPFVRMWMTDTNGDGFGDPNTENPYMNVSSRHSFNVGYDFSHTEELPNDPGASANDDTNPIVNYYTERVIKHWIEEYKIDGFRWDLTKGFTQNCSGGDDACTNAYQQDRVDILRSYADYAWSLDDTHYVIFEHLGTDTEEQQWANYRANEGKGIMLWGKMTDEYNELTMGQNGNKNINRMGHNSRGFDEPRLLGYPESHDEERLMYKNVTFGNSSNPSHNVTDLNTALSRMSALGAVSVLIPGPKMIWHFGDLGMDNSIYTCRDGSFYFVNDEDNCKLDTKPQPQWAENWLTDAIRGQIYSDWSDFHKLKIEEPVFEGDYTITSGNFTPRIDIFDTSIPVSQLRNVIIYSNFDVVAQTVSTNFPAGVTATWYDLMDPTGNTTVSNSTTSLTLQPGEFRILGNQASTVLSVDDVEMQELSIYPNPTRTRFRVNTTTSSIDIYDVTGKLVKSFSGDFNPSSEFDIEDLKTGIYMVQIENSNKQTETTKLIKL